MAVYSVGQLVDRATRRAQQPKARVRRNSFEKGTFEDGWYRPPERELFAQMCDGRRLVDRHVKKQRRGGRSPLGDVADAIIRACHRVIDKITGRLDISYDHLVAQTGYSRPTISRGIKALIAHGFMEKRRRCVRSDVADNEPGPRWRQATNAYRLMLPPLARRLLGFKGKSAPLSDDEKDRRARQSDAAVAMMDDIAPSEIGDLVTADAALAAALNRMGRNFWSDRPERELSNVAQPLPLLLLSCEDEGWR